MKFFRIFHPLGHYFRNSVFKGRNNQALTTFLRGSGQVYKEPEEIGGMDGLERTRNIIKQQKGFFKYKVLTLFIRLNRSLSYYKFMLNCTVLLDKLPLNCIIRYDK
jgi:hypothetical protein